MYNIKKHIRWKKVAEILGIMLVGSFITIAIMSFVVRHAINKYVEENRDEYYNHRVKEIKKQLKEIEK